MNWFDWVLVGWLILSSIASVLFIGVRREPISPGAAVFTLGVNAFFIYGLVTLT